MGSDDTTIRVRIPNIPAENRAEQKPDSSVAKAELQTRLAQLGVTAVSEEESGHILSLSMNSLKPDLDKDVAPTREAAGKAPAVENKSDKASGRVSLIDGSAFLVSINAMSAERLAKNLKNIVKAMGDIKEANAAEAAEKAIEALNTQSWTNALNVLLKVGTIAVAVLTLVASVAATVATAGAAGPGAGAITALVLSGLSTVGTVASAAGAFDNLPDDQKGIQIAFDVTMALMAVVATGGASLASAASKFAAKAGEEGIKEATKEVLKKIMQEIMEKLGKKGSSEVIMEMQEIGQQVTKEAVKEIGKEAAKTTAEQAQSMVGKMMNSIKDMSGIYDLSDVARTTKSISSHVAIGESAIGVGKIATDVRTGVLKTEEMGLRAEVTRYEDNQALTMSVLQKVIETAQKVTQEAMEIMEAHKQVSSSLMSAAAHARRM